jgi:hypothetical protein
MKMCRDRRLRPGAVVTRRLSRRGGHGIRSVGAGTIYSGVHWDSL